MESLSDKLKSMGVRIGARGVPRSKPRPEYSDAVIAGEKSLRRPMARGYSASESSTQPNMPTAIRRWPSRIWLERLCEWGRTMGSAARKQASLRCMPASSWPSLDEHAARY